MDLIKMIKEHYLLNWNEYSECIFNKEHIHELLPSFNVLKFAPTEKETHGFTQLVECQKMMRNRG